MIMVGNSDRANLSVCYLNNGSSIAGGQYLFVGIVSGVSWGVRKVSIRSWGRERM